VIPFDFGGVSLLRVQPMDTFWGRYLGQPQEEIRGNLAFRGLVILRPHEWGAFPAVGLRSFRFPGLRAGKPTKRRARFLAQARVPPATAGVDPRFGGQPIPAAAGWAGPGANMLPRLLEED